MSEVELVLVNDTDKCTIYTIQFSEEAESEYERFYSKFIEDAQLSHDLLRIVQVLDKIADEMMRDLDNTVCGSPTGFLFSVTEESKIRKHIRRMIRCGDMS